MLIALVSLRLRKEKYKINNELCLLTQTFKQTFFFNLKSLLFLSIPHYGFQMMSQSPEHGIEQVAQQQQQQCTQPKKAFKLLHD